MIFIFLFLTYFALYNRFLVHPTNYNWLKCVPFYGWIICYCREGNGTPLQYSCLENPMDGGAWWAAVHGVAKSRTWLSDFTFTFHFHALEKEMATHSSVLAWRIPGMGKPGGLPSMGSHKVGHDWHDLAAAAAAIQANSGLRNEDLCDSMEPLSAKEPLLVKHNKLLLEKIHDSYQ